MPDPGTVSVREMPSSGLSLVDLARSLSERASREARLTQPETLESLESVLLDTVNVRSGLNLFRSPINHLPVEILGHTLSLVPQRDDEAEDGLTIWSASPVRISDCVRLMSVCRFWRDIILGSTSLWNSIHNFLPSGILRAARLTSPRLHLDSRPKGEWATILSRNPLDVGEIQWKYSDALPLNFLKAPAPRLHSLTISAGLPGWNHSLLKGDNRELFCGQTPSLRRLALHHMKSLPPNKFANLTRLLLARSAHVQPSQLLSWLASSPRLEDLVIVETSFTAWDGTHPAMDALQYLRRLVIKDCHEEHLLWLISLPALTPGTAVRLDNVVLLPSGTTFSPYPAGQDIIRLALRTDGMMALGPATGLLYRRRGDQPSFDAVQSRISLSHITELWWLLGYSRANTADRLRQFLSAMPSLTTLVILGRDLPRVMKILSPSCPTEPHASSVVPCPHLTTLRVIISSPIWPHRYELPSSSGLSQFFASRVESGHSIDHLILESLPYEANPPDPIDSMEGVEFEWKKHIEWQSFEMTLPDVCAQRAHYYWPAWSVFAD
ncbi:hypothetical protein OBBRIDRAFT_807345 [Obba rivulosa]|uniref:F-box domain-containing protein n=1 Tax=Obba rivulosa TaxID=1052685 RepID=A0A8E2ANX9_9APHY|nr:hypothetical protein OBBRIDRAFT_807345 [Obba rivulosa]